MDSMRGLRTSLPNASHARRQPTQTPETLLQSFKQAALSVTALYKQAAADRADSHQQGYQDAIDELLAFLDKENIGLQDGEGWKIRSWATERAQAGNTDESQGVNRTEDEEEDEGDEVEARERSISPTKVNQDVSPADSLVLPARESIVPATAAAEKDKDTAILQALLLQTGSEARATPTFSVPSSDFAFRSSHVMPSLSDTDMDGPTSASRTSQPLASPTQAQYISRSHRHAHRSSAISRQNSRSGSVTSLGNGAGSKRKVPLESWFDITGFNGKDGSQGGATGGGKKGRYV